MKTSNGVLNITTEQKANLYKAFNEKTKKFYSDKKHIQSGMVQSWNKFCITGGIIEFSAKLPGDPSTGGLWPACECINLVSCLCVDVAASYSIRCRDTVWLLGNLARATYVGSSDYVWPFSYDICDEENRQSQEVSACSRVGHYGMEIGRGRGAPEIDVIESMQGDRKEKLPHTNVRRPYQSSSLQVGPLAFEARFPAQCTDVVGDHTSSRTSSCIL